MEKAAHQTDARLFYVLIKKLCPGFPQNGKFE